MLKPGTMLCERYKILEEVGSGGMSHVYKAQDLKLNRYVAVKVLKNEFSRDRNFVTKFRIEAQASAGLSHPNIVNVYDVVEEDGHYFIVMEFVDGITLKEYIEENGRLNMDKALDISLQIASGLEEAHEHHIIHRDIKPQNIIVSRNGNVKVTDFGIAKAATSNTLTSGAMGSVHYISPEQARGGYSDERSDIYSLGITMYEMVTGRVPFEGDNNVSVALMHIQNEMIPPRQYYPEDIYSSFEKIIMKATQKKPERRYLTASALIADLKRVQNNPNIDIVGQTGNTVSGNTKEWTKEDVETIRKEAALKENYADVTAGAVNPRQQAQANVSPDMYSMNIPVQNEMGELRPIGSQSTVQADNSRINEMFEDDPWERQFELEEQQREREAYAERERARTRRPQGNIKRVPDYEEEEYEEEDDGEIDSNLKLAVTIAGVATAIIICIIIFVVLGKVFGLFGSGSKKDTTTSTGTGITTEVIENKKMIDVVGVEESAAKKLLEDAGFKNVEFVHELNQDIQEGYVISTDPAKDNEIPVDTKITVKVSAGAEEVEVPDVAGYEQKQADLLIQEAGFRPVHGFEYSEEVEKDKVIRTEPAAKTMLAKGSDVKVILSQGSEKKEVAVPNLSGLTEQQARDLLASSKLKAGNVSREHSETVPKDQVISQNPPMNQPVEEGTSIDFVISDGPEEKQISYNANISGVITCNDEMLDGMAVTIQLMYNQSVVYSVDQIVNAGGSYNIQQTIENLEEKGGTADIVILDANGANVTGSFSKGNITITYDEVQH